MKRHLPRYISLAVIFLLLCTVAGALWTELTPEERALLRRILDEHPGLILSAVFLFPLAVIVALQWVFTHYIEPLGRLADEVSLMSRVNPAHRLNPGGTRRIRELAGAINASLGRIQELESNAEEERLASRRQAEEEKQILEALIQDFPDAVIVCNMEGQILLYNRKTRAVLDADASAESGGHIGLGRSIFGLIDRDLIVHGLDTIGRGSGGPDPRARFASRGPRGELLRAEMSPVRASDGSMRGFILWMRDVSTQLGRELHRDALLASLMERVRSSLATVRTAIELLAEHPGIGEEQRGRLTGAIRDETHALSAFMDSRRGEHAEFFRSQWPLEEMDLADVADALSQQARQSLDVTITQGPPAPGTWVRADSFTLVQALLHLARELKNSTGVTVFHTRLSGEGSLAALDIAWRGKPVPAATLREWERSKVRIAGEELPVTPEEIIRRHDGELWCGADAGGGRAYIRLVLHASVPPDAHGEPHVTVESRPEFYDFDLFVPGGVPPHQMESLLEVLSYTVFDTETTGLRPSEGDEIVSIGAVRIVNGRMLRGETFERLVDPGRGIPAGSTRVHGIDDSMVHGQPSISVALPEFDRFARDTVLVGHNAAFDMKFFQIKEAASGVHLGMPVLDTLLLSAAVNPHHDDHSIEGIAARLGVNIAGRHTALGDAIVTGEIFLRLLPLLAAKGITTLGEALRASRKTYLARVKY